MNAMRTESVLILRSRPKVGVSKDEASWFETRRFAVLLTMRIEVEWARHG
jgi:hypothetical protein